LAAALLRFFFFLAAAAAPVIASFVDVVVIAGFVLFVSFDSFLLVVGTVVGSVAVDGVEVVFVSAAILSKSAY
jgi:hypothetical protein